MFPVSLSFQRPPPPKKVRGGSSSDRDAESGSPSESEPTPSDSDSGKNSDQVLPHTQTQLPIGPWSETERILRQDFTPEKKAGGRGAKKAGGRGKKKVIHRLCDATCLGFWRLFFFLKPFPSVPTQKASSNSDSDSGSGSEKKIADSDSEDEKPRPALSGSESQSGSKSDSDSDPPPRKGPQARKKGLKSLFLTLFVFDTFLAPCYIYLYIVLIFYLFSSRKACTKASSTETKTSPGETGTFIILRQWQVSMLLWGI